MPRVVTAASSTSTSTSTSTNTSAATTATTATAATAAYETRYLDTLSRCYLPLQLQDPQDKQADSIAVRLGHGAQLTVVRTVRVVVGAECDLYAILGGVFECHCYSCLSS